MRDQRWSEDNSLSLWATEINTVISVSWGSATVCSSKSKHHQGVSGVWSITNEGKQEVNQKNTKSVKLRKIWNEYKENKQLETETDSEIKVQLKETDTSCDLMEVKGHQEGGEWGSIQTSACLDFYVTSSELFVVLSTWTVFRLTKIDLRVFCTKASETHKQSISWGTCTDSRGDHFLLHMNSTLT